MGVGRSYGITHSCTYSLTDVGPLLMRKDDDWQFKDFIWAFLFEGSQHSVGYFLFSCLNMHPLYCCCSPSKNITSQNPQLTFIIFGDNNNNCPIYTHFVHLVIRRIFFFVCIIRNSSLILQPCWRCITRQPLFTRKDPLKWVMELKTGVLVEWLGHFYLSFTSLTAKLCKRTASSTFSGNVLIYCTFYSFYMVLFSEQRESISDRAPLFLAISLFKIRGWI